MVSSSQIKNLAELMAADFSNHEQAYANPPFFAHIRVCMRPLPYDFLGATSLFLEQAYDFLPTHPYRLRVFKMAVVEDRIELEHYKLKNEGQFFGAARDREKLNLLTVDDLELMPGCGMIVESTFNGFKGYVKPGKGCIVVRNGKESYLDNSFEIDSEKLISFDRGRDPETDEMLWGSVAGPFHFIRTNSFAHEVEIS